MGSCDDHAVPDVRDSEYVVEPEDVFAEPRVRVSLPQNIHTIRKVDNSADMPAKVKVLHIMVWNKN